MKKLKCLVVISNAESVRDINNLVTNGIKMIFHTAHYMDMCDSGYCLLSE